MADRRAVTEVVMVGAAAVATDATITDKLYRTSLSGHFIYKERNADWYDVLAVSGFDANGEIRYFNGLLDNDPVGFVVKIEIPALPEQEAEVP